MPSALRSLLTLLHRHPAFTVLSVITIGLGIGASVAVFSVVEAVLIRPLPYENPDRLVDISPMSREPRRIWYHRLDIPALRSETGIFQDVAARGGDVTKVALMIGDDAFMVSSLSVSHNYLSLLGVRPALGRTFLAEDAVPAARPKEPDAPPPARGVVISYGLWQSAFGGDPAVIGRVVRLYNSPVTIIGVLPKTFRLLHARTDSWVTGSNVDIFAAFPEVYFAQGDPERTPFSILALARLRPNVSYGEAQAVLDALAARLRERLRRFDVQELQLRLFPLHEDLASGVRPIL